MKESPISADHPLAPRVDAADLTATCRALLETVGVPADEAELVVDCLVDADLRGVDTHGVTLIPPYVNFVRTGRTPASTEITVIHDHGATALLHGGRAWGPVAGARAVDLAMEKARQYGMGMVGVRSGGHLAALAWYATRAARQGFIAIAVQNGGPWVPAFGARSALLATNPIAFAVPTGGEPMLVFDVATTAVARRRMDLARERNEVIPEGWANDEEGRPTTDPHAASDLQLQWAGGYKGFGIALLVEVLAGVLTGSSFGLTNRETGPDSTEERISRGHAFLVVDPSRFGSADGFRADMDELIAQVHASDPAPGVDWVRVPGERAAQEHARRLRDGIPVSPVFLATLDALTTDLGLPTLKRRI